MHFSTALAAAAAVAPLVHAHGGAPAMPKMFGIKDLKSRNMFDTLKARLAEAGPVGHAKREILEARQNTDGQCGPGFGSCAAGYCCSESGWCGTDPDFCYSPGCQYAYGPGCAENKTPAGTNTSTVARTKLGSISYGGGGIYECTVPGTVALTYDDGPFQDYTAHILDIYKSYNARATFFITGNNINKGEIDTTAEFVSVIQRMYAEGHQIASHTWTHLDLSAISAVDRKNQMYKNEMALRNILGFFPTYMRPPYSSCTAGSGCETAMADLGYHIIYFNVDTDDYNQDSAVKIQNSKNWFKGNITAGGATAANSEWLSIAHDIHYQTAYNLTDYMLSTLTSLGYRAVTVGECLNDPVANWYRASAGGGSSSSSSSSSSSTTRTTSTSTSSAPTTSATKVSTDATCGGTNKYTCLGSTFGNCCSSAGWCGSTTEYCGTGCQSAYGTCGSSSSSSSTRTSTSSSSSSTSSRASSSSSTSTRASSTTTTTSTRTSSSSSTAPSSTNKVSTDATCGGTNKYTCLGSTFGNCCSSAGWCGSTSAYCGTGCQAAFGTCSGSSSSSSVRSSTTSTSSRASSTSTGTSSAAPSSTLKVSTDGTCAGTNKYTCKGSTFGTCCSQYGWCGTTTAHCGTGCLSAYGTCT